MPKFGAAGFRRPYSSTVFLDRIPRRLDTRFDLLEARLPLRFRFGNKASLSNRPGDSEDRRCRFQGASGRIGCERLRWHPRIRCLVRDTREPFSNSWDDAGLDRVGVPRFGGKTDPQRRHGFDL